MASSVAPAYPRSRNTPRAAPSTASRLRSICSQRRSRAAMSRLDTDSFQMSTVSDNRGVQDSQMRDLLKAWGPLEVIGILGGGNRNTVAEARLGTRRVVVRRSRRQAASLAWEAEFLNHLARHGLRVPAVVSSLDGRRHVDGVMVQTWLDGSPPA